MSSDALSASEEPDPRAVQDGTGTRVELLGARIRAARVARGIGVRELGRRVDCSGSLISQIERGRVNPSVNTLYAISAAPDQSTPERSRHGGATARGGPRLGRFAVAALRHASAGDHPGRSRCGAHGRDKFLAEQGLPEQDGVFGSTMGPRTLSRHVAARLRPRHPGMSEEMGASRTLHRQ